MFLGVLNFTLMFVNKISLKNIGWGIDWVITVSMKTYTSELTPFRVRIYKNPFIRGTTDCKTLDDSEPIGIGGPRTFTCL